MSADPDANYDYIRRTVAAATATRGRNIIAGTKSVSKRAGQGAYFTLGSAAEGVIDCGELSNVYRASECYKHRQKDGMFNEAVRKAKEYLRRASPRQLEAEWATDSCQIILAAHQEDQKSKGFK